MKITYSSKGIHKINTLFDSQEFPFYIEKAQNSFIYDRKGNKFVDFSMGKGSVTLGHANKKLNDVLVKQINLGQQYTFVPTNYKKLADSLSILSGKRLYKSMFLKNGSDAVRLAIRMARAFTQKEIILICGYHSWQDEFLHDLWSKAGVIKSPYIINFYYNLNKLESLFRKHYGNIAGILVTPEPGLLPISFYKNLKDMCKTNESLLIMDEIKCAYHESFFGISELLSLDPDLLLLSKGMANGYPISAINGLPEIIDSSDQSVVFGTYFYDAYGLALALETLKIYQEDQVISHLQQIGETLVKEISILFKITGTRAKVTGSYSLPILLFDSKEEESFFFKELFKRKIVLFPNDNIGLSTSHNKKVISKTLNAIEDILNLKPKKFLKGNSSFSEALDKLSIRKMIDRDVIKPQWI